MNTFENGKDFTGLLNYNKGGTLRKLLVFTAAMAIATSSLVAAEVSDFDLNMTDRDGESHNIADYLNNGQHVITHFTTQG